MLAESVLVFLTVAVSSPQGMETGSHPLLEGTILFLCTGVVAISDANECILSAFETDKKSSLADTRSETSATQTIDRLHGRLSARPHSGL